MTAFPGIFPSLYGGFGMDGPGAMEFAPFGYGAMQRIAFDPSIPPTPEKPVKPLDPIERVGYLPGMTTGILGGFPGFQDAPMTTPWLQWEMRKHPMMQLASAITTMPFLAGTRTMKILDDKGNPDLAQEMLDAANAELLPILNEALPGACEDLMMGHWLQEVQWDRANGRTVPVSLTSVLPMEATIFLDGQRRFAGFQIGEQFRDARYGFLSVEQPHIHPTLGFARTEAAKVPWWDSIQSAINIGKLQRKASGIQFVVYVPTGGMFLKMVLGQGAEGLTADQQVAKLDRWLQDKVQKASSGATIPVPAQLFSPDTLEQNPELAKIRAIEFVPINHGDSGPAMKASQEWRDICLRDMLRAWHRPEREATEGHHGTNAEAESQGAIGTLDSESLHTRYCAQWDAQVGKVYFDTNWGNDDRPIIGTVPAPLTDPTIVYLQKVWQALMTDTATGPDASSYIDLRGLAEKTELPLLSEEDRQKNLLAQQEQQAAQNAQEQPEDDKGNANGNGVKIAASANGNEHHGRPKAIEELLAMVKQSRRGLRDCLPCRQLQLDAGASDCDWKTINGEHVCIRNGSIVKGPSHLVGRSVHSATKVAHPDKAKSARALASAKHVGADIQRYSEEQNEPHLAKTLSNKNDHAVSLRDNEAADVIVHREGKIVHGVELKTMVDNSNNKITMKTAAMEKKAAWMKQNHAPMHTVVYDDQNVYSPDGKHGDPSSREIYYKRGYGSFRVGSMHRITGGANELKSLMEMPESALPEEAKPTANYIAARKAARIKG